MDEKPVDGSFTPKEMSSLIRHLVGNNYRYREQIIIPRTLGPVQIKSIDEKRVEVYKSFYHVIN